MQSARTAAGESVGLHDWDAFRVALPSQFVVLAVGFAMVLRMRHVTRSRLREEGIEVALLWAVVAQWLRDRRG